MHTPKEIAAAAVTHLKAAKSKAVAEGKTLGWDEVGAIIEAACLPKAEKPAADAKPTVEAIYAIYPRKVGKVAALKAIARVVVKLKGKEPEPLAYLMERTRQYSAAVALWPEDERHFCPHPATWFNQGRYDDNPREWVRAVASPTVSKTYDKI